MIVGQDLSILIDHETGAGALGGKHAHEEILLINDAGDVDGGKARRLVDINVVLLVGREAGGVRGFGFGPEASGVFHRLRHGPKQARQLQALRAPFAFRGDIPEAE